MTNDAAAVVFQVPPGSGGQGMLALEVIVSLMRTGRAVHGFGPAPVDASRWPPGVAQPEWHPAPPPPPAWLTRYSWMRWWSGQYVHLHAGRIARWAGREVPRLAPRSCYTFAEVGLETLRWARSAGVPSVVDSPTGDVRDFREVVERETRRWCGGRMTSHPSRPMVRRVVEEYELAGRVRVASSFSRRTMVERGVPAEKVHLVPYPLGGVARRFPWHRREPAPPSASAGPLRVCFVGALGLHKGFGYLLRAARRFGPGRIHVTLVGGTDSRCTRRVLEREGAGLGLAVAPSANPNEALRAAELLVHPTLHDGFGFVVAEAMATGLPVLTTDRCGAADLLRPGATGWVIAAGDGGDSFEDRLLAALEDAWGRRAELPAMGRAARDDIERLDPGYGGLVEWLGEGDTK